MVLEGGLHGARGWRDLFVASEPPYTLHSILQIYIENSILYTCHHEMANVPLPY